MRDELSAWVRSREATRRIMADAGCDEHGYPLDDEKERALDVERARFLMLARTL